MQTREGTLSFHLLSNPRERTSEFISTLVKIKSGHSHRTSWYCTLPYTYRALCITMRASLLSNAFTHSIHHTHNDTHTHSLCQHSVTFQGTVWRGGWGQRQTWQLNIKMPSYLSHSHAYTRTQGQGQLSRLCHKWPDRLLRHWFPHKLKSLIGVCEQCKNFNVY